MTFYVFLSCCSRFLEHWLKVEITELGLPCVVSRESASNFHLNGLRSHCIVYQNFRFCLYQLTLVTLCHPGVL